jgi:uncharacterized protein (TIGR02449 family)
METEFIILEQKIDQLIRHSAALDASNRSLRARVAMLEAENRRLADKVSGATRKIESVLAMLPEEEN